MDKNKLNIKKTNQTVEKEETNKIKQEDYGYDFVPTLSHSLNIDEQKVKAKRLENIEKKRGK